MSPGYKAQFAEAILPPFSFIFCELLYKAQHMCVLFLFPSIYKHCARFLHLFLHAEEFSEQSLLDHEVRATPHRDQIPGIFRPAVLWGRYMTVLDAVCRLFVIVISLFFVVHVLRTKSNSCS
jgi:hypothetical protein